MARGFFPARIGVPVLPVAVATGVTMLAARCGPAEGHRSAGVVQAAGDADGGAVRVITIEPAPRPTVIGRSA
jgi:hypothetical protein